MEQLTLLRGATQSITDNTLTTIIWDAKGIDSAGMVNLASDPEKIRISRAGLWLFTGFVTFAPHATGYREALVSEFDAGGAIADYGRTTIPSIGSVVSTAVPFTMQRALRVGEPGLYFGIRVRHTAGVALNVELARLSAVRLARFNP